MYTYAKLIAHFVCDTSNIIGFFLQMVKRMPPYSADNISHESDNFSKIVQV